MNRSICIIAIAVVYNVTRGYIAYRCFVLTALLPYVSLSASR
jgi:hypothetical protein